MKPQLPPALRPGDTIAVVAPASIPDRASSSKGIERLRRLGYAVEDVGPHRRTAADAERADAFRTALADSSVRAIFFARGGYGSARILPLVAGDLARVRPKILLGYSDTTAILNYAVTRHGWIAFHGPMVSAGLARLSVSDLGATIDLLAGSRAEPIRASAALSGGRAEGRLVGGCLSILLSLLRTPFEPSTAGSILFLEDVNEAPYRLDRMLTQLRQARLLERVRGLVFGEMHGCGPAAEVKRVLRERTADLSVPVLFGVASGHGRSRVTLPLGARVAIDSERRTIAILDRVVANSDFVS